MDAILISLPQISQISSLHVTGILIWSQWKNYEGVEDSCSKINLHANCLLGLLNTNCTNYTNMLLENEKNRKFLKISVGKFNIPHSALKDSITNLSKLAL